MSIITDQIRELINDPLSIKVVSTLNDDGTINTVPKGTLHTIGGDALEYAEILESSRCYKNAVRSLRFGKSTTVLVIGVGNRSYRLESFVEKILVDGREFEDTYRQYYEQKGFYITAIVRLKVKSVTDLDLKSGIERERIDKLFFTHLDQLVKENAA